MADTEITVNSNIPEGGTVVISAGAPTGATSSVGTKGRSVTISATPAPGYSFVRWDIVAQRDLTSMYVGSYSTDFDINTGPSFCSDPGAGDSSTQLILDVYPDNVTYVYVDAEGTRQANPGYYATGANPVQYWTVSGGRLDGGLRSCPTTNTGTPGGPPPPTGGPGEQGGPEGGPQAPTGGPVDEFGNPIFAT